MCHDRLRSPLPYLLFLSLCTGFGPASHAWGDTHIFGPGDGLPSSIVYTTYEDRQGLVWFGAAGGLAYSDGVQFIKDAGAPHDDIWAIREDAAGALWVGTVHGRVARRVNGAWCEFGISEGLPANRISCIFEDSRGTLWVGTENAGLFHLVGSGCPPSCHFEQDPQIPPGVTINVLYEDDLHNVWAGSSDGVFRYDGIQWTRPSTPYPQAGSDVVGIAQDASKRMWFADYWLGVCRVDGNVCVSISNGLPTPVTCMLLDREGTVYAGTFFGLARLSSNRWIVLGQDVGLAQNDVQSIMEDSRGALWLGTEFGGAARFDKVEWATYGVVNTADQILDNFLTAIVRGKNDTIWIGSYWGGVSSFDGTSWTARYVGFPLNVHIAALHQDRSGVMWAATDQGLARYSGTQWFMVPDEAVAGKEFTSMAEDSASGMWFGSGADGVFRLSGGIWTPFTTSDGLPVNRINALVTDSLGTVWVGTNDGIAYFDGVRWQKPASCYNGIICLFQGAGDLWVGSVPGIEHRYTSGSDCIPTPLPVEDIWRDERRAMWFATRGGVTRLAEGQWGTQTATDGLATDLVNGITELHGDLWFATSAGAVRHRPDLVAPIPVVTSRPPDLTASRSQTINYAARFRENDGIQFSYSWDGGIWSNWSPQAFWTGEPGDGGHSFRLVCRDRIGNMAPDTASFSFTLDSRPPSPVITFPAFGQPVRGLELISGITYDSLFVRFVVDVRPSGTGDGAWQVIASGNGTSSGPFPDTLGSWDTTALSDGNYDLRLSVTDRLGLTGAASITVVVDNREPFVDVTTPARVPTSSGGNVFTTDSGAHLYFPPHAFPQDALVTIAALADSMVPDTLRGAVRVRSGYELSWSGSVLSKPALLDFSYAGVPLPAGSLTLYQSVDGVEWQRVGGTVEGKAERVSASIVRPGRYALFAEATPSIGTRNLMEVSLTPRTFSPTGTFAAGQVGISFTLGRPASVTVRVYSRSGRLVREVLPQSPMNAGNNLVRWDGRDRNGGFVTDGLYLVTIQALGQTKSLPLAVVK